MGACRGLGFKEESSAGSSNSSLPGASANYSMPAFKPGLVSTNVLSTASLGAGPASNRIDTMKAAFRQQYMSSVRQTNYVVVD